MRILLIGGNGRVGRIVIEELSMRGHTVTALVRDLNSWGASNSLTTVRGSPLDLPSIVRAFEATPGDQPSAVIVTLNSPRASDNPFAKSIAPERLLARSVTNTLDAMKSKGVHKIVYLSAFGVGSSAASMSLVMRLLVKYSNLGLAYKDHEEVDSILRKSGVNWVQVRPTVFSEKEKLPVQEVGEEGRGLKLSDTISKRSVANFLVDAVESSKYDQKAIVIRN